MATTTSSRRCSLTMAVVSWFLLRASSGLVHVQRPGQNRATSSLTRRTPPTTSTSSRLPSSQQQQQHHHHHHHQWKLRLASSSSSARPNTVGSSPFDSSVSRRSTLQTLLAKHGAPGSKFCSKPRDLEPVGDALQDTPELVASMMSSSGGGEDSELSNLHPYLYPIARSTSSKSYYVCAYRNPFVEESGDVGHPWPIVEARVRGGMQLLALNSEHLMRRIACECDGSSDDSDDGETPEEKESIIQLYNEGLGKGLLADAALDTPYELGSVDKLGYGVDKFVLLRVGPFPDLYEKMSLQHSSKGDEQSSLIAAEAANSKLQGFGSTFKFYARVLQSLGEGRSEEARDAARMCLRLPLPTIGLSHDDLKEVAVIGQIADENDSIEVAVSKLKVMYDKMREVEQEDAQNPMDQQGKSPQQMVLDECAYLIDETLIASNGDVEWNSIRSKLGALLRKAGLDDMASFVDLQSSR